MAELKVVALNGSPHEGFGNTGQMIAMLRRHLEAEGAALEEIVLAKRHIEYCTGCAMCIQKGGCWIRDDHKGILQALLEADGVILASPVYFFHVTAQMKTFIDRSLGHGHRPRDAWKPGLAVSVSAGAGETATADYLGFVMRAFGAFHLGSLTAMALDGGAFVGADLVDLRAGVLAREMAAAIREKRRYPATDKDLHFFQFIGKLAQNNPELLKADHEHWKARGLFNDFEKYVGQTRSSTNVEIKDLKVWLKGLMEEYKTRGSCG